MNRRTNLSFPCPIDIWPEVDRWASVTGFELRESTAAGRLYQKGHGFWVAPMMLAISQQNGIVNLESWVRINVFTRIMSLFMLPSEMCIESGGFRGVVPRSMARNAINGLLQQLRAPLIP